MKTKLIAAVLLTLLIIVACTPNGPIDEDGSLPALQAPSEGDVQDFSEDAIGHATGTPWGDPKDRFILSTYHLTLQEAESGAVQLSGIPAAGRLFRLKGYTSDYDYAKSRWKPLSSITFESEQPKSGSAPGIYLEGNVDFSPAKQARIYIARLCEGRKCEWVQRIVQWEPMLSVSSPNDDAVYSETLARSLPIYLRVKSTQAQIESIYEIPVEITNPTGEITTINLINARNTCENSICDALFTAIWSGSAAGKYHAVVPRFRHEFDFLVLLDDKFAADVLEAGLIANDIQTQNELFAIDQSYAELTDIGMLRLVGIYKGSTTRVLVTIDRIDPIQAIEFADSMDSDNIEIIGSTPVIKKYNADGTEYSWVNQDSIPVLVNVREEPVDFGSGTGEVVAMDSVTGFVSAEQTQSSGSGVLETYLKQIPNPSTPEVIVAPSSTSTSQCIDYSLTCPDGSRLDTNGMTCDCDALSCPYETAGWSGSSFELDGGGNPIESTHAEVWGHLACPDGTPADCSAGTPSCVNGQAPTLLNQNGQPVVFTTPPEDANYGGKKQRTEDGKLVQYWFACLPDTARCPPQPVCYDQEGGIAKTSQGDPVQPICTSGVQGGVSKETKDVIEAVAAAQTKLDAKVQMANDNYKKSMLAINKEADDCFKKLDDNRGPCGSLYKAAQAALGTPQFPAAQQAYEACTKNSKGYGEWSGDISKKADDCREKRRQKEDSAWQNRQNTVSFATSEFTKTVSPPPDETTRTPPGECTDTKVYPPYEALAPMTVMVIDIDTIKIIQTFSKGQATAEERANVLQLNSAIHSWGTKAIKMIRRVSGRAEGKGDLISQVKKAVKGNAPVPLRAVFDPKGAAKDKLKGILPGASTLIDLASDAADVQTPVDDAVDVVARDIKEQIAGSEKGQLILDTAGTINEISGADFLTYYEKMLDEIKKAVEETGKIAAEQAKAGWYKIGFQKHVMTLKCIRKVVCEKGKVSNTCDVIAMDGAKLNPEIQPQGARSEGGDGWFAAPEAVNEVTGKLHKTYIDNVNRPAKQRMDQFISDCAKMCGG